MNLFDNLTHDNFGMYAVKFYDNPSCHTVAEFNEDLKIFAYIKRMLRRINDADTIDASKLRVLLNHIIIIFNVFPATVATRLLFLKMENTLWPILKAVLLFLNFMPNTILGINNDDILSANILADDNILQELRKI